MSPALPAALTAQPPGLPMAQFDLGAYARLSHQLCPNRRPHQPGSVSNARPTSRRIAHVVASDNMWRSRPSDRARRAAEIAHALSVARARSAILLGDFNCSPSIDAGDYQRILAAGYADAYAADGNANDCASAPTWDRQNPHNRRGWHRHAPSQRIDHVFVPERDGIAAQTAAIVLRDSIAAGAAEPLPLSDHYGLLATLRRTAASAVARPRSAAARRCGAPEPAATL
jgi:endonuclease/exonuclease/phosphatase (EEP) superfamily protein YafD